MVKAIVGANWGDEGKGKITDMLRRPPTWSSAIRGGANAGHTIINDQGRFALHTLPSGAFYPHVTNNHRQRPGAGHPQAGGRAPLPPPSRECPPPT